MVFGIRFAWDAAEGQRDPNAETMLKLWARKYLHMEVEDLFTKIERGALFVADRGMRR
jgi:hypothetical protein